MIPQLSLTPEARDITFRDSCNCCFKRPTSPSTHVYVNSVGDVVEFDKTKTASEADAIVRSIDNLARIVHRMIEDREFDRQEILDNISQKIHSMQQNSDVCLTRGDVQEIVERIHSSPKRRK